MWIFTDPLLNAGGYHQRYGRGLLARTYLDYILARYVRIFTTSLPNSPNLLPPKESAHTLRTAVFSASFPNIRNGKRPL